MVRSCPVKFGALPRCEADLLVIVANAEINKAKTTKEVLAHLASVHPFIELPDLIVDAPPKLNGPVIASINAAARYGIVGEAIPVEQTDAYPPSRSWNGQGHDQLHRGASRWSLRPSSIVGACHLNC
jgi:2-keto-4-pentenoate hydratase